MGWKYKSKPCQHCKRRVGTQARGLCRACHSNPSIREQYPASGRYFASINDVFQPPLPPYSTNAIPGSLEKIEIMRERYLSGYHIHHPNDVVYIGDLLFKSAS